MAFPISPILANLYMMFFEEKSLRTVQNPLRFWERFVNGMSVTQFIEHKENFLQHINIIDSAIQFTVEDAQPDGSMLFLAILVTPDQNGSLTTRVYSKPMYINQYIVM